MELYGEKGTLYVPDPNFFGGELRLNTGDGAVVPDAWKHPFAVANDGGEANYRGAGLAEMALAIRQGRPHRCNDNLALHVVEVMTAILRSGETGLVQTILSNCARPAPFSPADARGLIA
jgi:predicted dehydrogenase